MSWGLLSKLSAQFSEDVGGRLSWLLQCRNPTVMSVAIDVHDAIVRKVIARNFGHEVSLSFLSLSDAWYIQHTCQALA